ncbi:MAG: hypothetical protein J6Z32_00765 [Bacteroidales bacterium]|nr:hypothetical protein [Bacteroidales bacterium]
MKKGCYPFSLEPEFETRLRQIINTTVEMDKLYLHNPNMAYAFDNQIPLWMFGFLY